MPERSNVLLKVLHGHKPNIQNFEPRKKNLVNLHEIFLKY